MNFKYFRSLGGLSNIWDDYNNLGDETNTITVEVNNVLAEKKINNVFGVIKGFVDAGMMRIKQRTVCVVRNSV